MDAGAADSLMGCAARATLRGANTEAVEKSLQELHAHLFAAASATADQQGSCPSLLARIHTARSSLDTAHGHTRNDLDTAKLLMEAVLTLGEVLVSAAAGQRARSKCVRRLEDVVLPILFIRSAATPLLLRTHALAAPWAEFQAAVEASGKEAEKLHRVFAAWKANHGWDFLSSSESTRPLNEVAVSPAELRTTALLREGTGCGSAAASSEPRVVLQDISWNAALRRSAGAGIPSYLLTKRRRVDDHNSAAPGLPCPHPSAAVASSPPHTTIDHPDTPRDSHVFAVKSPVRRRRIDFTAGVPPSPDRPGVHL